MYRLAYWFYRGWTTLLYWGRRRFTSTGLAMVAVLVVTSVAGLDTEKSLTHQLFTILASIMLLSLLCSVRFPIRFSAERKLPRFGSVGLSMPYSVIIRNKTRTHQRGLVLLENLSDPRPDFEEYVAQKKADDKRTGTFSFHRKLAKRPPRTLAKTREASLPDLTPEGEAEVAMELTPLRRGVIRFTGVTLGRPDPFGLFKSFAVAPLAQTVLVLPRRYFLPPIAMPGSMKYQQGGVALASSIGESEEFVSLRDYRPGDPLRRIHWKSWAKTGEPVVKEFEDEFFVRHALILDTFLAEPDSVVFEEAVSVAASFACTVQTQESLLDLLFVGTEAYCFTAGRGIGHTEQLLEVLAAVRTCAGKPFAHLSHLVLNHVGVVSGCIVILLTWDEERKNLLQKLRQTGVPLMTLIIAESSSMASLKKAVAADNGGPIHFIEVSKVEEGLLKLG